MEPENTMTKNNTTPVKSTMKLIAGTEAINKAIDSIASRGKKLDRDIHIAAVSCMAHHAEHGDVTLINRLVDNMPKGSRVNALREYIMAYGKVQWDAENNCFKHDREGTFDREGAIENAWTEFKPEPTYKPFDAVKAISQIVKRVQDADADKGDRVTAEQAEAILALAAKLGVEA